MSCLGILFSLDEKMVREIKSLTPDEEKVNYVSVQIESPFTKHSPQHMALFDKSWDALHRCLTDGRFDYDNGTFPLSHVIMGGERLYFKSDFIITLKTPEQVKEIAQAVEQIDKAELRKRYFEMNEDDYDGPFNEDDFEYTWEWFEESKPFWELAAKENRYVLFTADQ
jgi:hypothetical protein